MASDATQDTYNNLLQNRAALVVEDDQTMAEVFAEVISEAGFDVTHCADGKSALAAFAAGMYPLVILDWNLPDLSGLELCRKIRNLRKGELVYILLSTGNDLPSMLSTALETGADDYIGKPFRLDELRVRLAVAEKQLRHRVNQARAEAERDREREFQQILIEAIPLPVFFKDTAGIYLGCNNAFAELLQIDKNDIIGKPVNVITHPAQAEEFKRRDRELFEGPALVQVYEWTFQRHDLSERQVIFTKAKFNLPGGKLGGIIGVIQDISSLRQAEQALIRAQQLAAVGTLAAGIAHEFNNINTSLLGNLQILLSEHRLQPESAQLAERAFKAAQRAADLTMKLLSFAGPGKFIKRPVSLNQIVHDTAKIIETEFASKGVTISVTEGESPQASADPAQIGQVLMNLLINARHACLGRAEKSIRIETGAADGRCFLQVADTGCGIEESDLPRLFLPFFSTKGEHSRGETVQSKVKGTGLGLSISDTIIRDHGGEITVRSRPGLGSVFTVWLPLAEKPASPAEKSRKGAIKGAGGRILVLDDEEDVQEVIRQILRRRGYTVDVFSDGDAALASVTANRYDLALVDLQMPRMSGFEFLERVAAISGHKPKAIILTGRVFMAEGGARQPDTYDVAGYLEKPFDIESLVASVNQALA